MTAASPSPPPKNQSAPPDRSSGPHSFHLGYRPGLNGFRGIAMLLVLLSHLDFVGETAGFVGVDMFFVLSGFLITCLLIQEWKQSGKISLRAFYLRRALRLLPALLALIAGILVYSWIILPNRDAFFHEVKEAIGALFYFTNWLLALKLMHIETFAPTWTLSIEEQFYLIWPVLLLFLLHRVDPKSALYYTLLGALLAWLTRFLLYSGTAADFMRLSRGLDTRADSLLIGCALGILLSFGSLPEGRWVKIVLRWGSFAAAAGLALIAGFAMDSSPWMCCLGWSLMSLCSAVLIAQIIISSKTIFHRVLENRLLVYLGTISYGLYLWHRPVIMAVLHYHLPRLEHVIVSTTIFTALTLASYYLLELPCLRLKKRFQKAD